MLLRARPPEDLSTGDPSLPAGHYELRRSDALAFVGAPSSSGLEAARHADPRCRSCAATLGIDPGPAIGRILDVIDEERAAGTISTREEALALARELAAVEASA